MSEMYKEDDADRYLPVYGPNSKQWWVYDECKDVYIDPPAEVLREVRIAGNLVFDEAVETHGDWVQAEEQQMYKEIEKAMQSEDNWLLDSEYWYNDIEI